MDFTEFLNALEKPLYEVKGEEGEDKKGCPVGYKWDKKNKMCVPKTSSDRVDGGRGEPMQAMDGYNVWGATGLNGDGYAIEEDMDHDYEKEDEKEEEFKKADERMKYGKEGKPQTKNPLRKGEVRKINSKGEWESNKK